MSMGYRYIVLLTMMSCCSSNVPLFENTGAGSLNQILVAQVGSGDEPGGVRDQETRAQAPAEEVRIM